MLDITRLDPALIAHIAELRKEAAKYRHQRRGARAEADRLRESNAGLRHELATLRAELETRRECRECHCQIASDAAKRVEGQCPRSGEPLENCPIGQSCCG